MDGGVSTGDCEEGTSLFRDDWGVRGGGNCLEARLLSSDLTSEFLCSTLFSSVLTTFSSIRLLALLVWRVTGSSGSILRLFLLEGASSNVIFVSLSYFKSSSSGS